MPVRRYRLDLAYDGTLFHGWAAQPGLRTVQGVLEEALTLVLREPITLTVAGRTDAGVHADHQVAHFDYQGELPPRFVSRLQRLLVREYAELWRGAELSALNRHLGRASAGDVVVRGIEEVSFDFDARFSALSRRYRYRLADRQSHLNPLARSWQWWVDEALAVEKMREGAKYLIGEHDFLSFCRPRAGATTIRHLREVTITRAEVIEVSPVADAFCHSMVRSLVGALVEVGRGKREPGWIGELVDNPERSHGVPIAPPMGLVLEGVDYPLPEQWGQRAKSARRRRDECC